MDPDPDPGGPKTHVDPADPDPDSDSDPDRQHVIKGQITRETVSLNAIFNIDFFVRRG
jgi:hypothetical protein